MALFAIADLHLSLGEDKPMDVFAGWNDYTSRLEIIGESLLPIMTRLLCRAIFPGQ